MGTQSTWGIYSKMASRSLLRLTTSQRSPIISLVQRQLSTSPKVFSPWRKGIWGYIFIIPFREGKDTNHGYQYRIPVNLPEKKLANIAEVMMALLWWWILFHCFTEPAHLFGEYPWKNPKDYTDEELGIPKK